MAEDVFVLPSTRAAPSGAAGATDADSPAWPATGAPPGPSEPPGWLLVDFDHTLLAANSTELFVGHATPALLVAPLDFVLSRLVPWGRLGPGLAHRRRDWARCRAIALLTPWNRARWRRDAPGLFARLHAPEIAAHCAAAPVDRRAIVSFGQEGVIAPMLADSPLATMPVLATPAAPPRGWHARGKAELVARAFGPGVVAGARVFTDSEDDRDLLDAAADPRLIAPQGAPHRAAQVHYLPLRYAGSVKYGRSHVLDQWLFVDAAVAALAVSRGLADLLAMAVIAPLLTLSVLAIYELGYHENDFAAARLEDAPQLSGKEAAYAGYSLGWRAWLWAAILAAPALWLAARFGPAPRVAGAWALPAWLGILAGVRLIFAAYNRLPPARRIAAYAPLQVARLAPVPLLLGATPVGAMVVLAQVMTMWANYCVYRVGGKRQGFPKEGFRLGTLALALGALALGGVAAITPAGVPVLAAALLWAGARLAKAPLLARFRQHRRRR